MIIGNGMMAKRFLSAYEHDERTLIFASGVSNSLERSPQAFQREEDLLRECIRKYKDQTLVYFGTCAIFDPSLHRSAYVLHKYRMEDLVRTSSQQYLICRTSNIVGNNGSPHTLINFFVNKIIASQEFDIWINSYRNILDIDDLYNAVHGLLEKNETPGLTVNIACPFYYSVREIVHTLESHLQKKALYKIVEKGSRFSIPEIIDWNETPEHNMLSKEYYLNNVVGKYHPVLQQAF